jgi:hypothetical protein
MDLPFHQQDQALLKAHGADAALLHWLLQRLGHAHPLELAQWIHCGVHHPSNALKRPWQRQKYGSARHLPML